MDPKYNKATGDWNQCRAPKICCCCDGDAGVWEQWHNRDNGYGVCTVCVSNMRKNTLPEDIIDLYGHEGIHWGESK